MRPGELPLVGGLPIAVASLIALAGFVIGALCPPETVFTIVRGWFA